MSGVTADSVSGNAEFGWPACRPSPAAAGSGRPPRPWSSAGRRAHPAPPARPACAPGAACRPAAGARARRRRGWCSARSTRAPAATAARAERRRLASSKLASRLAVARTSRRIRRSSQASTLSCAPMRVSSAPIASPSRTTTRSEPRTSRALDATPSRRPTPTSAERRLGRRAGDLERAGPARFGQRAVGQERAAPGGLGVGDAAGDDLLRQSPHRPAAQIDQAGLAGQPLAVLGDPHEVAAAFAQAAAGQDLHLGAVAEDLGDLFAQPSGRRAGVELGLDDDVPADQVQGAGEAQHGRDLGAAGRRSWLTITRDSSSLTAAVIAMLDSPLSSAQSSTYGSPRRRARAGPSRTPRRTPAPSRTGSCRSSPPSAVSVDTTRRARDAR